MSSATRYLLPGRVLVADLVPAGTAAILIPKGTVLTPDVIAKIRQAGFEDEAQKRVASRKQAIDAGIPLRQVEPRVRLASPEASRHKTRKVLEAVAGLRTVLYFLLAASGLFAAVTMAVPFIWVTGLVFAGLAGSYVSTSAVSVMFKREIANLARIEEAAQHARMDLSRRLAAGDEQAIAGAILANVVSQEDIVHLDIERGTVVLHALLPDSRVLVRRAGLTLAQRPLLRDASALRSLRQAKSADLDLLLDALSELVLGIFTESPTTQWVGVSIFDPFQDPDSATVFLGCLGSIGLDRYAVSLLTKEAELSLLIGQLTELKLDYDRDGAFREVPTAVPEQNESDEGAS